MNLRALSAAAAAILLAAAHTSAAITDTHAVVRPDNSLIADIEVTASEGATQVFAAYQAGGVEPLISQAVAVSTAGRATLTIGRLRANTAYTYTVTAVDGAGNPAGTASGSFSTGPLPAALSTLELSLTGRTTVPLVILPLMIGGPPGFRGYVALDLHSSDAPQIVWYHGNPNAVGAIEREQNGNFLFADAGSGPPPLAADAFLREIAPDGALLNRSPSDCSITPVPPILPAGWIWGQGNDVAEAIVVDGAVLHFGKVVKDPFFDAGQASPGTRLQLGATIRRWDPATGVDQVVWDPFAFLDPLAERTGGALSDPAANSDSRIPMPCAGASLLVEDWMHANSLQFTPAGRILMSIRHLDTVIAISPRFDSIQWRIGGPSSDFNFPDPADRFHHQHFARMLDTGNLLLMDNGNARPAAEGGPYSRALELALDWDAMTASKFWEYRHPSGPGGAYKYADKVGSAQRLENGNTLVLFGADIDPGTLLVYDPQTFTLVEADATPEAKALAVLEIRIPGNFPIYRALPIKTLFGE